MRDQAASAVGLIHAATVKSFRLLTIPAGSVAYPPLSASALPATPGENAAVPVSVPFCAFPDESDSDVPELSLAAYSASASVVTVNDSFALKFVAVAFTVAAPVV